MQAKPENPKPSFSIRRVFVIIFILLGGSTTLVWLSYPNIFRSPYKGRNISEAVYYSRQIGRLLLEFDSEYGAFPNRGTASEVTKRLSGHNFDLSGNSSNSLFRQLVASGLIQSEETFRARVKSARKPDGIITPGEALKKGEVGFSYISGLSTKDDPSTPIVLTPLIPGTTKFDPKPFDGKAIVLHIDGSVTSYEIEKDGHIYDSTGINLLSLKHPIWKGKAPDIRFPEL